MSSFPKLATLPQSPQQQPRLHGVMADYPPCVGSVETLPDGRARVLFDGDPRGIYANVARANDGLRVFRNMGLCT